MGVFKTRWFGRWADRHGLVAADLCRAVREMEQGLYEADLGAGLFKKRVARPGRGKSSGFRTLIATNRGSRWVFVYGFPKSERGNVNNEERDALKKLAVHLLTLDAHSWSRAQAAGELTEVPCHEQDEIADS